MLSLVGELEYLGLALSGPILTVYLGLGSKCKHNCKQAIPFTDEDKNGMRDWVEGWI